MESYPGVPLASDLLEVRGTAQTLSFAPAVVRKLDGEILHWSRGSEALYGWSAEEAVGRRSHELLRTVFPAPIEEIEASLRTQSVWSGELNHFRRDGTPIIVASYWVLDGGGKNEPPRVVEFNHDITERRRAEEALRQSNSRLQILYDIASELLTIRNPNDLIDQIFRRLSAELALEVYFHFRVTPEGERLHLEAYDGVPADAAAALEWLEFGQAVCGTVAQQRRPMLVEDVKNSSDPLTRLIRTLGIQAYFCQPLLAGSRLIGTLSFGSRQRTRFEPEEIDLLEAVARHVGFAIERSSLIGDLASNNARLESVNRDLARSNQDLEQFAYAVSHDLQEPLRTVANLTQLMERQFSAQLGPEFQHLTCQVVDGSHRMAALIRDLLSYCFIGHEQKPVEPTDAKAVLGWVLANLKQGLDESGATVVCGPLPPVALGFNELAQVFQNLIGNSIKYRHPERPLCIEITASRMEDRSVFSVRDNAVGIAPEHRQRIFGVFKRLHGRDVPGNGIGLALCKRIVERYGGEIWVESEPGVGSTFCFSVPI